MDLHLHFIITSIMIKTYTYHPWKVKHYNLWHATTTLSIMAQWYALQKKGTHQNPKYISIKINWGNIIKNYMKRSNKNRNAKIKVITEWYNRLTK